MLFSITVIVISCDKDEKVQNCNQDIQCLRSSIKSEWLWHHSINPWDQEISTPESTGEKLMYRFTTDTLHVYLNDMLTESLAYEIVEEANDILNPDSGTTPKLVLENRGPDFFSISNDTLRINKTPYDGPDEYYIRL